MDSWAGAKKYDCHFICACVVGDRSAANLSREFGQELKLKHCINGFIDNQGDMPSYGQLGCNGFIVLDETHKVISQATSAFMQVRDLAFKHVETILDATFAKRPLPAVCPGEFVMLEAGADRPGLNGEQGICVNVLDDTFLEVQLMTGQYKKRTAKVPFTVVRKLENEESEEEEEEEGMDMTGSCGPGGCGPRGSESGGCGPSEGAGCSPGGCDKPGCAKRGEEAMDMDFVSAKLDLVSVKVPSMDAEHEDCAEALQMLATMLVSPALEAVLSVLKSHFQHEEALFEEHGWGNNSDERFSAKRTHVEDHKRILQKIRRQLGTGAGEVPAAFVKELLQDFHEHTSRYDVQYAEELNSKGAQ